LAEKEITIEIKNLEIFVLLFFLTIVLILELIVTFNNPIVFGDEGYHARIAQLIAEKVEYFTWEPFHYTKTSYRGFYRLPLLHILTAGLLFVFGNSEAVINFLIPFLAFLTGISAFFLGKEFYNRKVGLFAAIITATMPSFVTYSVLVYTEILVTFFSILFFIFFVLGIRREKTIYIAASGVFGVLAFLSKTSGFTVYIFALLAFLYHMLVKKRYALVKKYLLLFFILIVFLVPFLMRNLYYYNAPLCAFPYLDRFLDTSGCEIEMFKGKYRFSGRTDVGGTEQSVYRMGIINYLDFAYGNLWFVVFAALSGLFIVLSRHEKYDIFILLIFLIFLPVFNVSTKRAEDTARYTLIYGPFIALLAGRWFYEVYRFIRRYQKYIAVMIFLFPLVLGYQNLTAKLDIMARVKQFSPSFFEACDWIKENLPENITISTIWTNRAIYCSQRNAIGHSADIYLSRDVNYTKKVAKERGITHLFIQKFSISTSDKALSEKYKLESIQFFEDHPETFKKLYENGPSLQQCMQMGFCDGNIIYEIVY